VATIRRVKRVLSSFDLVLLGEWERDPTQRRALLSLLRGAALVGPMSDADVAAALALPSSSRAGGDAPFQRPFLPLPSRERPPTQLRAPNENKRAPIPEEHFEVVVPPPQPTMFCPCIEPARKVDLNPPLCVVAL
jgi:hypothetical protein